MNVVAVSTMTGDGIYTIVPSIVQQKLMNQEPKTGMRGRETRHRKRRTRYGSYYMI